MSLKWKDFLQNQKISQEKKQAVEYSDAYAVYTPKSVLLQLPLWVGLICVKHRNLN